MTIPVVIVSYNTREVLRRCLQSLRSCTLPIEPVVVDNGSQDGSVEMIRADFPEVRLLEADANLGFARANNLALRQLNLEQYRYVLLLNPDAELTPHALETLAAFLDAHPRVGLVAPRLLYPDGSFQAAAFRFPSLLMAIFDLWPPRGPGFGRLYHHPLNGRYRRDGGAEPFAIDHPLGAAMLVRNEVLQAVGLFDESFWLYAEEVELCWRIRQAGWAIWQEPRATVVHVGGSSSEQFQIRSFLALHKARQQLFTKIRSPRWNQAYRVILRLGMLTRTLAALRDLLVGRISKAEFRRRTWAWGSLQRPKTQSEWYGFRSTEQAHDSHK